MDNLGEMQIQQIREDFPILFQKIEGHDLVYLDNAATTQLPRPVLNSIIYHFEHDNANVHRGASTLSKRSTQKMEQAREIVAGFIGSPTAEQVIFTSGATAGINMIARAWGEANIKAGDTVIVSIMEHHSNYLPWLRLCEKNGAHLEVIGLLPDGRLDQQELYRALEKGVKLLAIAHVSNVTGVVNPLDEIIRAAHDSNCAVLVDGAQGIREFGVDVKALNLDFYTFSGHKMMAPSGIGAAYIRDDRLAEMDLDNVGGGMVNRVSPQKIDYESAPLCFEAGTPNISGAIALGEAVKYLEGIGQSEIQRRELYLTKILEDRISAIPGVKVLGIAPQRASCVSIAVPRVHHFDLAALLDCQGIAARAGRHCAQPLHDFFGVTGSLRFSPAFYNTETEIDAAIVAMEKSLSMLRE